LEGIGITNSSRNFPVLLYITSLCKQAFANDKHIHSFEILFRAIATENCRISPRCIGHLSARFLSSAAQYALWTPRLTGTCQLEAILTP